MSGQERTEAPTPQRRQELRQQGRVPRSVEVQNAAALLGAFLGFGIFWQQVLPLLRTVARDSFASLDRGELGPAELSGLAASWGVTFFRITLPVFATVWAAGMFAAFVQTGFLVTEGPLQPDLDRINPLKGLQRLFSPTALVELAKAVLKLGIVGFLAWSLVEARLGQFLTLPQLTLAASVALWGELALDVGIKSALCMLAVAGLDYGYQRWSFERQVRMTRQEVRESLRQTEGDPQVRARLRAQARRYARGRMLQAVPSATVVVTNPVHLAVALAYRPGEMAAPRVVAKGERLLAQRIRAVAQEHRVPVVENPPLAWALHRGAQVGDYIPTALYQAVAEVLAFVLSLGASAAGHASPTAEERAPSRGADSGAQE